MRVPPVFPHGRVEDRRVPPPMPFLSRLQKLIWNPPHRVEDTSDPPRSSRPRPVVRSRSRRRMTQEDFDRISREFQRSVAKKRREKRSGR